MGHPSELHEQKCSQTPFYASLSLKRFGFNKSELVTVFKGYIRPLLEYSDVIWHSSLTSNQTHQLERVQKRAFRIILGTDYISYANALDVCDVDRLSARREQRSQNFAQSLPKCSRTSKLLPPCRGEIHGRQLRNNAKLTQPRDRTNRYACSPIPYYVELINSKLPQLDFLLSIFFIGRLFDSLATCFSVVYCCTFKNVILAILCILSSQDLYCKL